MMICRVASMSWPLPQFTYAILLTYKFMDLYIYLWIAICINYIRCELMRSKMLANNDISLLASNIKHTQSIWKFV